MPCLSSTLPSLHLVFDTTIPTSHYIFEKCFIYLFVCYFVVHHKGGCCSGTLFSGARKYISDQAFAMDQRLGARGPSLGGGAEPL